MKTVAQQRTGYSGQSIWREALCMGLLSATLVLAGCIDPNKQSMSEAQAQREAEAAREAQAVADAVRAQAERLEAIRQQELLRRQQEVPVVTWLDPSSLHRPTPADDAATKPAAAVDETSQATITEPDNAADAAGTATAEPVVHTTPVPEVTKQLTTDELMARLLDAQRHEQGDALTNAVNIAALLGMTGKDAFEPRDLEALSEPQKTRMVHYQKLTALLREQAISPGGVTHYQSILNHLDSLMADVPLHIRKVAIARSVSSFGVYQPMETHTFLAGRPQPMIVYVELEHYKSIKGENGKYAVKLAQELVLYNESDGLAVWREPRVQIADESMNQRRDFFVVQRIELPARLTVGKYLLKVTMSDMQGGSIDETSVPIQVVADVTMVKKP